MFGVFTTVKQFLTLLTLFSLDFYSSSKRPKNKANSLLSSRSREGQKTSSSRRKISFSENSSCVFLPRSSKPSSKLIAGCPCSFEPVLSCSHFATNGCAAGRKRPGRRL